MDGKWKENCFSDGVDIDKNDDDVDCNLDQLRVALGVCYESDSLALRPWVNANVIAMHSSDY